MKKYKFPSSGSSDIEEARLGALLKSYASPNCSMYDENFNKKLRNMGWIPKSEKLEVTKKEIDIFYRKHGYLPSGGKKRNLQERKLAYTFNALTYKNGLLYNLEFAKKHEHSIGFKEFNRIQIQNSIQKFIKEYGYLPSKESNDLKEKSLGQHLRNYINKNGRSYDKVFTKKIEKVPNLRQFIKETNINNIKKFIRENGHRPSSISIDPVEKMLGVAFRMYTTKTCLSFDRIFTKEVGNVLDKDKYRTNGKKEVLLNFIKENGRKPQQRSKNIEERKLFSALMRYTQSSQHMMDENFKNQVNDLYKELGI